VFLHNSERLYPLLPIINDVLGTTLTPRRFDTQIAKMRGNAELGAAADRALRRLPGDSFVFTRHYQDGSILAFYTPGRPNTRDIGSYLTGPEQTRRSQFDLWPHRSMEDPAILGSDAVFMGSLDDAGVIRRAFDRVVQAEEVVIQRQGQEVRRAKLWLCYGFKGIERPATAHH
jgi:hypothetical protein